MLRNKKDVDRHVCLLYNKIESDYERNLKGFTLAKLYVNVGDYDSAALQCCKYLQVRGNSALAHQLSGEIAVNRAKYPEALEAYQRALTLQSPDQQKDTLSKIIDLLTNHINKNFNKDKAK